MHGDCKTAVDGRHRAVHMVSDRSLTLIRSQQTLSRTCLSAESWGPRRRTCRSCWNRLRSSLWEWTAVAPAASMQLLGHCHCQSTAVHTRMITTSCHNNNNKKDNYRQQNVRQRQKLISIIDYDVCILEYLQPFWRFSTSKNGLTVKSGYGVLQGHWKRRGSIDHVWLSISPPL